MSFSENSIMTRSRAIYSKRLTHRNYNELLNCSSVNEAADYLSSKTQYFNTFGSSASAKINRMMIESLLKRNFSEQFLSLYRFSKIIGNKMCDFFVNFNEINAIISCMRYVLSQNKLDTFISVPNFEDKSIKLDVMSLANSENIDELISKLNKTQYFDVLKLFINNKPDIVKIENALYGYLDEKTCENAKKSLSKGEYRQVYEIFAINSDLRFISKIFRLKKYFKQSPEEINNYLFLPTVTLLTKKEIDKLIFAKDESDYLKAVGETVYGKDRELQKIEDVTLWARQYKYDRFSKRILYSTYPNEVMMCCFYLMENEVKNVTSIIEGIKYSVDRDRITRHLVGFNC